MPKYNDFNLDIQKTTVEIKDSSLKSCWGCLSRYVDCVKTDDCKKN